MVADSTPQCRVVKDIDIPYRYWADIHVMGESVEVSVQLCQEEVIPFCSTSRQTRITLYLGGQNWFHFFVFLSLSLSLLSSQYRFQLHSALHIARTIAKALVPSTHQCTNAQNCLYSSETRNVRLISLRNNIRAIVQRSWDERSDIPYPRGDSFLPLLSHRIGTSVHHHHQPSYQREIIRETGFTATSCIKSARALAICESQKFSSLLLATDLYLASHALF